MGVSVTWVSDDVEYKTLYEPPRGPVVITKIESDVQYSSYDDGYEDYEVTIHFTADVNFEE